jgi:seryl-tRNA synthetase
MHVVRSSYVNYRLTVKPCITPAEKGGNPELVRESQRRRYADVGLVDKVLDLDAQWRQGKREKAQLARAPGMVERS